MTLPASPILVMSFNRPDYLAQVLDSLAAQAGAAIGARQIHLFQDGAVNPFSGRRHAEDSDIAHCVEVFRRIFPGGTVHASPVNLGVALNFDRAERLAYTMLEAECAIFLEDDLVLGPHYIATVDRLAARFRDDERVGYVSAYGDHTRDLAYQTEHQRRLSIMTHNWGFALYRRHWLKMQPYIQAYLELVKDCDYREKDRDKIKALFESWGFGHPAISQDAAKTIASTAEKAIKVNTLACHATYIGERGLHMNSRIFQERGYKNTTVFPSPVLEFEDLTPALFQKIFVDQRDWANSRLVETRRAAGQNGTAVKEGILPTGDIQVSAELATEFVTAIYRSVLGRDPDPDGMTNYCNLYKGKPLPEAVARTIQGLLASREFRERRDKVTNDRDKV